MGLGSFLKKYAAAKNIVSPATQPHTSVSTEMTGGKNALSPATQNTMLPATQNADAVLRQTLSPATLPVKSSAALTHVKGVVHLYREISQIPREERMLRDEKCLYVKYCWELKQKGVSWEDAARIVASEKASALPRLAAKNMLHFNNLRNWRARLCPDPNNRRPTSDEPDFRYADNLIRNYGGNRDVMKGDPLFCKQLYAICLTKNLVKLNKEYRNLAALWLERYPDRQIPTISAYRHWMNKMPPRLVAMATKGPAFYAQHYQNYIPRDPDTIEVNEAWVGDNLECDFYIRDRNGRAVRPWLTAIQDIKSQYIVGMVLSDEGVNSADIRAALAGAVREYGRPRIFLTDNGSDFCKRGFTTPVVFTPSLNNSETYEHCILKELDIEHRTADPYNAKAKLVERFFRELNEHSREQRGWVGNCIENRPATAELWSRPENVRYLPNRDEAAQFIAEKLGIFHNTPSPESKYLKGLSPAQAFRSANRMTRPVLSDIDLAFAFLTPIPEARFVEPRGPSVKVGKIRYVAKEGAENLWHYDNLPVMVKFDMMSINYCFIFDLDGAFLAVAHAEEEIPYFADTEDEKERLSKALADIRHEEKVLRAMILRQTGGFERLDPRTISMLPPESFAKNACVRLIDTQNKVKGNTHLAKIYALASEVEDLSDQPDHSPEKKKVSPATQKSKKNFLAVINGEDEPQKRRIFRAEQEEEEKNNVSINPY